MGPATAYHHQREAELLFLHGTKLWIRSDAYQDGVHVVHAAVIQ
jgi:hypothetical protein